MEQYKKLEKIGEGSFGVVYKALNEKNGETVAVKKVRMQLDVGVQVTAVLEIALLKQLKHENIVTLHDAIMQKNRLFLIFECLSMNLRTYLDMLPQKTIMDRSVMKSYLHQVTSAIYFCHQQGIIHLNLKPQNLLLGKNGTIKVADFGMGQEVGIPAREYTQQMSTLWYKAPEILLRSPRYSFAIDIWSLGCVFAEMARRLPLFQGESQISQLLQIFKVLKTPNEIIWPGLTNLPGYKETFPSWTVYKLFKEVENLESRGLDLMQRMLTYDPAQRISAKEIMMHDYFSDMHLHVKQSEAHTQKR